MSTYRRVLALIDRGTPLPQIVDRVDAREDAVLAMVESMVRSGHVQDLSCAGEACAACPMSDGCPVPQDGPAQYYVTDAGRALLADDAADTSVASAPASERSP